jgi:hypothetical protein
MSPSQQAFGPAVDLGVLTQTLRFKREELQPGSEADGRRQAESYGAEAFRERIDAYLPDHYKSA